MDDSTITASLAGAIAPATAIRWHQDGPGAKAPGQRPPRPRRALLARRVGRWPLSFPDLPIYKAPFRAGGGNAMRFLVPPEQATALPPLDWQGPSPLPQRPAAPGGPAARAPPDRGGAPARPRGGGSGSCPSASGPCGWQFLGRQSGPGLPPGSCRICPRVMGGTAPSAAPSCPLAGAFRASPGRARRDNQRQVCGPPHCACAQRLRQQDLANARQGRSQPVLRAHSFL